MHKIPILILCLAGFAVASCAESQTDPPTTILVAKDQTPLCDMVVTDPMQGFTSMDVMTWIDVPDSDPVRATAPIENWLAGPLGRDEITAPLTKTYCQIGLTDMVTNYRHGVEGDDAIVGMTYRAIYIWNAETEFPGWELSQLGQRSECGRGRDEATGLCL